MHDALVAPDSKSKYKTLKQAKFVCIAPGAEQVFLVGNFNQWDPVSHPMQRQPDGIWRLQVPLPLGYHQYLFLVDGKPELDPLARGVGRNAQGQRASLMVVR